MSQKYELPIYATATSDNIQIAIDKGIINKFAYVYLKDTGKLVFVDPSLQIHPIKGDNIEYIQKVDSLDIESGNETVLYLMNGVYYIFDGEKYQPFFKDVDDQIDLLSETISQALIDINSELHGLDEKINNSLDEAKKYTDDTVTEALKIIEYRGNNVEEGDVDDDI